MLRPNTRTTRPRQQHPRHPPPTQRARDIEAARRHTHELYHSPPPEPSLSTWYIHGLPDASIKSRMSDLYKDYETTLSRHGMFTNLKLESKADDVLGEVYARVVGVYSERLTYIHACGMEIAALLGCWIDELARSDENTNPDFVAACESTLAFLEVDYVCRKLDFETEIYALVESWDAQSAEMVRRDLKELWPWMKADFVMRLKTLVVDYEGVELANHTFVREGSSANVVPHTPANSPGLGQMPTGLWGKDNADWL